MRIAGIYPQKIDLDPKIQHAVGEPYGLEKILAIAKEDGHEVNLFLPAKEESGQITSVPEEEFIEQIADYKPDIAAFSMYTCQYPLGKRVAAELKKRFPGIRTVAGNRYPSFLGERIEDMFDFFVVKEGELTFRELLGAMQNGQNFGGVKGITFKKGETPVFTGIRNRNLDLDSMPDALRFPVILKQVYKAISLPPLSENPHYAVMEYSRCCYSNCKFCDNDGFWGNKVVFRSPGRVVDELFRLKDQGVDIFYFMDLNFTAVPKKTVELCDEMIKRNVNASWYCMSNIATVDGNEELLDRMKEAGCYKIAWGIESTNDAALEKMNKRTGKKILTNEQARRVLGTSLEKGIINQGYYIIGFPWETEESILGDAESLKYLPLHQLNVGIFTPIPLSRFYEGMAADGYTFDPDLEKHDRNNLVYNHKTLTNGSIKKIQENLHSDFYDSVQYRDRVRETCRENPVLAKSFSDYFEFLGKEATR